MERTHHTWFFLTLLTLSLLLFALDRLSLFAFVRGTLESFVVRNMQNIQSIQVGKPEDKAIDVQVKLAELERLKRENEDLRAQLGIRERRSTDNLLLAHVLSTSRFFIIDKGEEDGVRVDSTVVYKNILVGKVITVGKHVSRVLLPTEEEKGIKGQTARTKAKGLVKGKAEKVIFADVTQSEKLEEGDIVITMGVVDEKGLGIQPHLLIGTIASVRKADDPLYQEAHILPLLDYKSLENVFVIL